jgi:hypothetical protein
MIEPGSNYSNYPIRKSIKSNFQMLLTFLKKMRLLSWAIFVLFIEKFNLS